MSPSSLALSVAFGIVIGIFPVLGVSTLLLAIIALALRLNLPAIQLVNYLMYPLQLLLIIPFVRLGEHVLGVAAQPLSISAGIQLLQHGAWQAIHALSAAILHAALGWALLGPALIYLLYRVFSAIFVRLAAQYRRTDLR